MTGVAVKSGLLTRESQPHCQQPSHSVILTGIPTRTTAHWAAAGSQRAATIPVIDSFNPYVNWPLFPLFPVMVHDANGIWQPWMDAKKWRAGRTV
eukprot:354737-Chlamydomonas_euryale.AAC.1